MAEVVLENQLKIMFYLFFLSKSESTFLKFFFSDHLRYSRLHYGHLCAYVECPFESRFSEGFWVLTTLSSPSLNCWYRPPAL